MARKRPAKKRPSDRKDEATFDLRLEKPLLERCTALAKKKRVSLDALIERSIRVLLAAEGQ